MGLSVIVIFTVLVVIISYLQVNYVCSLLGTQNPQGPSQTLQKSEGRNVRREYGNSVFLRPHSSERGASKSQTEASAITMTVTDEPSIRTKHCQLLEE